MSTDQAESKHIAKSKNDRTENQKRQFTNFK